MEILLNCILWYFIIFVCLFICVIGDEYLVIKKYGRETYNKFKPYDYKTNLLITGIWPIIFVIGVYIFIKHYILKKD